MRACEERLPGAVLFDDERTCLGPQELYSQEIVSLVRLLTECGLRNTRVQRVATLDEAALAHGTRPGLRLVVGDGNTTEPCLLTWRDRNGAYQTSRPETLLNG